MIDLDAATVLAQIMAGMALFLWVTTRRREVGLGYGWLMRGLLIAFGIGALVAAAFTEVVVGREVLVAAATLASALGLAMSIHRRKAGVSGQQAEAERRSERVAAMTGIDRDVSAPVETATRELPPTIDLIAAVLAFAALPFGAHAAIADGTFAVSLTRTLIGAAFLGCVTDAMLLGHWYLVQPGLRRAPIFQLNRWLAILWPFEVIAMLLPTGMISALDGTIDDGYNGILGWFWVASAIATIALCAATHFALKERQYSAVMAATGMLYLAILTAAGTDLVARAILA